MVDILTSLSCHLPEVSLIISVNLHFILLFSDDFVAIFLFSSNSTLGNSATSHPPPHSPLCCAMFLPVTMFNMVGGYLKFVNVIAILSEFWGSMLLSRYHYSSFRYILYASILALFLNVGKAHMLNLSLLISLALYTRFKILLSSYFLNHLELIFSFLIIYCFSRLRSPDIFFYLSNFWFSAQNVCRGMYGGVYYI